MKDAPPAVLHGTVHTPNRDKPAHDPRTLAPLRGDRKHSRVACVLFVDMFSFTTE